MAEISEPRNIHLVTIGRVSGLPRETEIWFVAVNGKHYVMSEGFRRANWVRNIERNSRVKAIIGDEQFDATARILDENNDCVLWNAVSNFVNKKYGWRSGACWAQTVVV